jgi:hypothetical protein
MPPTRERRQTSPSKLSPAPRPSPGGTVAVLIAAGKSGAGDQSGCPCRHLAPLCTTRASRALPPHVPLLPGCVRHRRGRHRSDRAERLRAARRRCGYHGCGRRHRGNRRSGRDSGVAVPHAAVVAASKGGHRSQAMGSPAAAEAEGGQCRNQPGWPMENGPDPSAPGSGFYKSGSGRRAYPGREEEGRSEGMKEWRERWGTRGNE